MLCRFRPFVRVSWGVSKLFSPANRCAVRLLSNINTTNATNPSDNKNEIFSTQSKVVHRSSNSSVSSNSSNSSNADDEEVEQDPTFPEKLKAASTVGKLKLLWNRYGVVFLGTYFTVYGATLCGLFYTLDTGMLSASTMGMDSVEVVHKLCDMLEENFGVKGLPKYFRENPRMGTLGVAWVATKMVEPIRLGATLVIVPQLASHLRKKKREQKQQERQCNSS